MIRFLAENRGTILTGLVLLGIVTAIILKIRRDIKKGKAAGCRASCFCCRGNTAHLPDCDKMENDKKQRFD